MPLSARETDRLGERIKGGDVTDQDRHLLEELRVSYLPAYQEVVGRIREVMGLHPSGRPDKRLESIVAKLQREETSLSQMQDIAGCRIVVEDWEQQNWVVQGLVQVFERTRVVDRRQKPRHGYRAVHVIVRTQGRPVEVQVRTFLQDLWANVVEGLSSEAGDLKHGVELPDYAGTLALMADAADAIAFAERERGLDSLTAAETAKLTLREGALYRTGLFRGSVWSAMHFHLRRIQR